MILPCQNCGQNDVNFVNYKNKTKNIRIIFVASFKKRKHL